MKPFPRISPVMRLKQRGAIARKLAITLGVVAAIVVVAGAALFIVGMNTSAETIVEMKAEEENAGKGEMVDPITRFDGAFAEGATLVMRYTIVDGWLEGLSPAVRDHLGSDATLDDLVALIAELVPEDVCSLRSKLGRDEIIVVFDYRDERSAPLLAVEATNASC